MSAVAYSYMPNPPYMPERFDRHSFDPDSNRQHQHTLQTLRTPGRSRAWHYVNCIRWPRWPYERKHEKDHFYCCGSSALRGLSNDAFTDLRERGLEGKEVYLDIGAGDSPDVLIAKGFGYKAYSIDLFPPMLYSPVRERLIQSDSKFYIKADALALPFDDWSADYVSSQAMIDLIPTRERTSFYREVCRVLKIGGVFSMTGATLKCGHGYRIGIENHRARQIPFWEVTSMFNGFKAMRTH